MLGYLSRAVPLENLLEREAEEDRLFAQRVGNIRRYAIDELGLSASKNYTRYVELDRNYLAAVVSASARDSFTTHLWWFPIVGRLPYKGFFNPEDARREAARLERRDLDVWIRSVDAFSTLGWFRDPLFSFMKNYSEIRLAELIIHELFHATVFLNGHVQFNEELATFVGILGSRLYMEKMYGESWEEYVDQAAEEDFTVFLSFVHGLIAELEELYNSNISYDEKMINREIIIRTAQRNFLFNYDDNFKTENFRGFGNMEINNAYLDLFRLYYEQDMYFFNLFERTSKDLGEFIRAAKTLNRSGSLRRGRGNPREELEMALGLGN